MNVSNAVAVNRYMTIDKTQSKTQQINVSRLTTSDKQIDVYLSDVNKKRMMISQLFNV